MAGTLAVAMAMALAMAVCFIGFLWHWPLGGLIPILSSSIFLSKVFFSSIFVCLCLYQSVSVRFCPFEDFFCF